MAVLLSSIISRSISDPLKRLVGAMNKAKGGELSSNIKDYSRDELAEVTSNFNSMLDEIKLLIESVKDKEKQKRIAEIKALQAQINPHFLSNTLNSVKWLANIQRAENIEKLITALIELLHASMGKGTELITLREEIGYVKEYIVIEEFRYYDKFKVCFELQEDVLDLKILKFLLQPIIENSLIHGIEPMSGQGMIIVKAFLDSENLKIVVTDNGLGIPEERMMGILEEKFKSNKSSFSGIGICNIRDRIKMYFGEEYGVHIESIPNLYTTVELTLPITR
jgi:Predicted signal transduction protein with a C-terminal ATPase domain